MSQLPHRCPNYPALSVGCEAAVNQNRREAPQNPEFIIHQSSLSFPPFINHHYLSCNMPPSFLKKVKK